MISMKLRTVQIALQFLIFVALVFAYQDANAQISRGGTPKSFELNLPGDIPRVKMPAIDLARLEAEDVVNDQSNLPYRFAQPFTVSYNLQNSGIWVDLPNGDRIWRFEISCPGALSVNLLYDRFYMPPGALYYLYNEDRTQILGAFGSHNNKPHGKFATALIFNETIILDYYEPAAVKGQGQLSIAQVSHGYRPVIHFENAEGLGDAGNCQVNVNCSPEGDNWQVTKKAAALITLNGFALCSGTLLNNTAQDCTPYFLTADHCIDPTFDAVTNPNIGGMVFYWNFERPGCANTGPVPTETTSGATVVANPSSSSVANTSDFALLELGENPNDDYDVYFAGWDASGTPGNTGVGIHHPAGDAKKIATHDIVPQSVVNNHYWRIFWSQTPNGWSVTEGGSSGSGLFNQDHRIIGQLFGGFAGGQPNCNDPANDEGDYGKLSFSWDNAGATDSHRRLRDWLDPVGNGTNQVMTGAADPCGSNTCDLTSAGLSNVSCNNNGTPDNPTDDFYTFTLNPAGIDLGTSYTVTGGGVTPTTANYGAPASFSTAPGTVGGGNIMITITDSNNGGCTITATIVDNGGCDNSEPCDLQDAGLSNIICDDRGTANPNDDTFTFQLNPTGTGLSDVYKVDGYRVGPRQANYGGPTTFQTSIGSVNNGDLVITITDSEDPDCQLVIIVPSPGPCSGTPTCNLSNAGLSNVACNDNGTPTDPSDDLITFSLDPDGTNLSGGYTVSGTGMIPASGSYGASTGFAAQPGTAGSGALVLTITDNEDPDCQLLVTVNDPGVCSVSNTCLISVDGLSGVVCMDNDTATDPSDDFISFSLNPSGSTLGATYTLSGPGIATSTGNPYGIATAFSSFNGTAGNGNLILTITDDSDPNCTLSVTIMDPGSCSDDNGGGGNGDCGLDQVSCQSVTLVIGANGTVVINPQDVLVVDDPDCNYTVLQLAPRSTTYRCFQLGNTSALFRITDTDGNSMNCSATVTVIDPNGFCDESGADGESLGGSGSVETNAVSKLEAYPNPVKTQLFVALPGNGLGLGTLFLYNSYGQVVRKELIEADTQRRLQLNVSDLAEGVYVLSYYFNGERYQTRVVINR